MEVVHSSGSGAQWADVKYCWSGVYGGELLHLRDGTFVRRPHRWINAEDYDYWNGVLRGYHSDDPEHVGEYYHPANRWDYYICKIVAKDPATGEMDKSFGWIEVWFWTGGIDSDGKIFPPSAYGLRQQRQVLFRGFDH